MDLLVAVVAGLAFAVAIRVRWYVPIGDGLALAAAAYMFYLLTGAIIR